MRKFLLFNIIYHLLCRKKKSDLLFKRTYSPDEPVFPFNDFLCPIIQSSAFLFFLFYGTINFPLWILEQINVCTWSRYIPTVVVDIKILNVRKIFWNIYTLNNRVKPAYAVISIRQSPVLKGHLFLALS